MRGQDPRLAEVTLPITHETASALHRLLGLQSTRNRELQEVPLGDPGAAVAVFRRLGDTRQGANEQAADAAHAVSLIGIDPFRRLLDDLPLGARGPSGTGRPAPIPQSPPS